ncbi:unnamed protein product [Symbiodinium necroappetens]|uniref:Uncharacterized protein n=1 Tax=Symbiodinium necroappetens TaxID=1628268 RepID=A0A812T2K4_9DINO|nr:unnamed protein product [Symbiodinium necroappetens]
MAVCSAAASWQLNLGLVRYVPLNCLHCWDVSTFDRTAIEATSTDVSSDDSQRRDEDFLARLRGLAKEALTWPHLTEELRLMWTVVLKTDTVPLQELPPWFLERQNLSRRSMGIDLISLDGQQAVLCRSASVNSSVLHRDIKRFLRTARWVCKA